jgi:hypothetical protein
MEKKQIKAKFKPRDPIKISTSLQKVDQDKVWYFEHAFTLSTGGVYYETVDPLFTSSSPINILDLEEVENK